MIDYTKDSPAVTRAVDTFWDTLGTFHVSMAAVLNEHKRGLRGELRVALHANAELAAGALTAFECGRAAAQSAPNAVALPSVDAIRDLLARRPEGVFYSDMARDVLALLAASLPAWQPVTPGTVIKAGTRYRTEWADDSDGVTAVEKVSGRDFRIDPTDPGRFYIDPRTVPAEPVDPDAAAVEAMADEAWRVIGQFPGLDITFQAGTDADRDLCELIARAALAAYRTHIDKEA